MTRLRALLGRLRGRGAPPVERAEPLRLDAVDACRHAPYHALLERRRRSRR